MLKRRIKPGERFNKKIHTDRRTGPKDRRMYQAKPVKTEERKKAWSLGTKVDYYNRIDPITKERTVEKDQRSPINDRRKKEK